MSDFRTDRPYWCEICARKKECYGITLKPKCFVPKDEPKTQNSNLTFEKDEYAKEYEELGLKELKELIEADSKTEPITSDEITDDDLLYLDDLYNGVILA